MSCSTYYNGGVVAFPSQKSGNCISLLGTSLGPYDIDLPVGRYLIELWGASGGNSTFESVIQGGLGAYTSGILELHVSRTFFFFVGTAGGNSNVGTPGNGGYNGGSKGATDNVNNDCASGGSGGSSDMRIIKGQFDDSLSLLSRIMISGGGGSAGCWSNGGQGGSGGINGTSGFSNQNGVNSGGLGGSQIKGFSLCIGGRGQIGNEAGGSGGGGYWGGYGGKAGLSTGGSGGGGGSSYVSGHPDCIAIDSTKQPLSSSIHPSKFSFISPVIIQGNQSIPSFESQTQKETKGHKGNGCARITLISHLSYLTCNNVRTKIHPLIMFLCIVMKT